MSRGNKSQIIVYEQTRAVYIFMLNGSKQRKEIIHYFTDKWTEDGIFGIGVSVASKHRTIDNYIKKVRNTFFNFENEVASEKGRSLARLDDLYNKCVKIQDYKGALVVLKEINDITGMKITKIDNISSDGSMSPIDTSTLNEEQKKVLLQLARNQKNE